jgi:serine phosphatase RsbU (regulator of sigma subunit)
MIDDIVRRERAEIEREISRRIRDESGPSVLAALHGYKVRVRRAGPVDGGGDFFDVFKDALKPREIRVAMGSVSGVGIAACVAATTSRHTLRGVCGANADDDSRAAVDTIRNILGSTLHPGSALSLLLARLNDNGKVSMGAMGGTGVFHYKAATEEVEILRPPGRRDEEAARPEALEASLKADDRLFLTSDGAGALRDKGGEPFGAERLATLIGETAKGGIPTKELLATLITEYVDFSAGAPERDVTLIVLSKAAAE